MLCSLLWRAATSTDATRDRALSERSPNICKAMLTPFPSTGQYLKFPAALSTRQPTSLVVRGKENSAGRRSSAPSWPAVSIAHFSHRVSKLGGGARERYAERWLIRRHGPALRLKPSQFVATRAQAASARAQPSTLTFWRSSARGRAARLCTPHRVRLEVRLPRLSHREKGAHCACCRERARGLSIAVRAVALRGLDVGKKSGASASRQCERLRAPRALPPR